jgi:RNA-binding proteins (RRM domain)
MKVYFGNLSKETSDAQLTDLVKQYGATSSVEIVKEHGSGTSKGFGFVEFPDDEHAKAAIAGLNGKEVQGNALKVNEAKPRK